MIYPLIRFRCAGGILDLLAADVVRLHPGYHLRGVCDHQVKWMWRFQINWNAEEEEVVINSMARSAE